MDKAMAVSPVNNNTSEMVVKVAQKRQEMVFKMERRWDSLYIFPPEFFSLF
jgi:hypothetical protein